MTMAETALYGVVGLISVILAVWSLARPQDRSPKLAKGFALLSFTYAIMFVFILLRAWGLDSDPNQLLVAGLAAGLMSVAAVLFARQATLARKGNRQPPL